MSISVNFHGIEKCEASELPNVENDVLKIHAKDGSLLNLYMPMAMAQAMANAFNRVQRANELPRCDTCGEPDYGLDEAGDCDECVDKRVAREYAKYRPLYDAEKAAGLLKSKAEYEQELRDAGRSHLIGNAAIGGEV